MCQTSNHHYLQHFARLHQKLVRNCGIPDPSNIHHIEPVVSQYWTKCIIENSILCSIDRRLSLHNGLKNNYDSIFSRSYAIKISICHSKMIPAIRKQFWARINFGVTHCYSVPLIVGEDYDGIGQVVDKLHRFRNRLGCLLGCWQHVHYCRLWYLDFSLWKIPNQHHHRCHQIQNNRNQIGHWPNPNLIFC